MNVNPKTKSGKEVTFKLTIENPVGNTTGATVDEVNQTIEKYCSGNDTTVTANKYYVQVKTRVFSDACTIFKRLTYLDYFVTMNTTTD